MNFNQKICILPKLIKRKIIPNWTSVGLNVLSINCWKFTHGLTGWRVPANGLYAGFSGGAPREGSGRIWAVPVGCTDSQGYDVPGEQALSAPWPGSQKYTSGLAPKGEVLSFLHSNCHWSVAREFGAMFPGPVTILNISSYSIILGMGLWICEEEGEGETSQPFWKLLQGYQICYCLQFCKSTVQPALWITCDENHFSLSSWHFFCFFYTVQLN